MAGAEKKHTVDEKKNRIAVEIDIESSPRIEEIMEDLRSYRMMEEPGGEDSFNLKQT